jgi:cation:H+ antiporter
MLVSILLFLLSLLLLIKGGDWLVDGATAIARRLKMSELLIGATVVSIGTTLPEVMVSASSALSGHGEIAYGNAIGSIICNTALIAALTIAVRPGKVNRKSFKLPVLFFFLAATVYLLAAYLLGSFPRLIGLLLLLLFVSYLLLSVRQAKAEEKTDNPSPVSDIPSPKSPLYREILFLILGAVLIAIGADLLVENGTKIAGWMGVPESVIALTFVALGTSLPELVTAIVSLVKGHGSLSLGNVIGANFFNLALVTGLSSLLSPFEIPASQTLLGINRSLLLDLPVMVLVMVFLTLPALKKGKLSRVQGILLLILYLLFCLLQFL